jgi:16S rRNA (cytosine967-C5)-methyltransferase
VVVPPQQREREISREEAAAEVLVLWEQEHPSLRRAINQLMKDWDITDWQIRTAIHSLVFETVRRLNTIDRVLNSALEKSTITDLDALTRNILRIATYLIVIGKGSAPLVTNEAVSIIKRRKNKRIAGFVNAVLRKIQAIDLASFLSALPPEEQAVFRFSAPLWLIEFAEEILGTKEARDFLEAGLHNPNVIIRVNTLLHSVDETIKELERDEFHCITFPKIPEMLKLQRGSKPVTQTQIYLENGIYLQSFASALVSRIASPTEESVVVDLCAAPGSKTSHMAQLMKNQGSIVAIDNIASRISELERNLNRLNVKNTHSILASGLSLPLRKDFRADIVLVDPPCGNTGVLQTRPEVKWYMSPKHIQKICRIQMALLKAGAKLVSMNGCIVYSTCSITLDENEHIIHQFLKTHSGFELIPIEPEVGSSGFKGLSKCRRLFPHRDQTEGFFIAKLCRKSAVIRR